MRKMFAIAVAAVFVLSLLGVAIAQNDMGAGGPFTSPIIAKDDYLSPATGTFEAATGQTAVAAAKMPAVATGGLSVSPLLVRDDTLSPYFTGSGKVSGTFSGEVVAIDENARRLTVNSIGPNVSPLIARDDSLAIPYGAGGGFALSETSMLACDMSTDFHHISVGDQVNIRYEEKGGKYIAKLADSSAPLMACNLQ